MLLENYTSLIRKIFSFNSLSEYLFCIGIVFLETQYSKAPTLSGFAFLAESNSVIDLYPKNLSLFLKAFSFLASVMYLTNESAFLSDKIPFF